MADTAVQTGTIHTRIPARLDRLPWSAFHWRVLIGLGTVWILDGFEVTIVGAVSSRLTQAGSGIAFTAADAGVAGAIYIIGACLGALFFGQLTDRFGRKKLFMLTLGLYIVATVFTGGAQVTIWFFIGRFFTGAGIGGEYAAINSAIDELIPARLRGRIDLTINGTFWAGSIIGSALALLFLDEAIFPGNIGWRLAFFVGALMGFTILLVRRHVPESPRWLFIHGREEEAERIVRGIEHEVEQETGAELEEPGETLTVRQRKTIGFMEIGRVAFKMYPKRAILGIALFVGQAFIYNGITFNLGTLFTTFYGVSASFVPIFVILYAVGNLLGPLTLGRLFDTIGRKPMISGTYLASAIVTIPLALVFLFHVWNEWLLIALIMITFFLASAGASAAYLTVSEVFPMETRALAIAFFYAIGTAVGGISGPLLFGNLINSDQRPLVTIAFFIGAAVMALGGITEIFFGVKAERQSLESIALPLTAADAEGGGPQGPAGTDGEQGRAAGEQQEQQLAAQGCREEAEQARARAAEHRAEAYEVAVAAEHDPEARNRQQVARTLAEIDELRADELEEQAVAHDELAEARASTGAAGALSRAQAAEQRARMLAERAAALSTERAEDSEWHLARAEAAEERSRAREQRALAERALAGYPGGGRDTAGGGGRPSGAHPAEPAAADGEDAAPAGQPSRERVARARAEMHRLWAELHEERAAAHDALAEHDTEAKARHDNRAAEVEQLGLAAEQRLQAAEHRASAEDLHGEREAVEEQRARVAEAAEREARAREREARIRQRLEQRQEHERAGLRRLRPGASPALSSPWLGGVIPSPRASEESLEHEVDVLVRALGEHGPTQRQELSRMVGARYWGPGRFGTALDTAVDEGRVRRLSRRTYGPADHDGAGPGDGPSPAGDGEHTDGSQ